jgi:hypothetical protein
MLAVPAVSYPELAGVPGAPDPWPLRQNQSSELTMEIRVSGQYGSPALEAARLITLRAVVKASSELSVVTET